jgi:hypothetical protein
VRENIHLMEVCPPCSPVNGLAYSGEAGLKLAGKGRLEGLEECICYLPVSTFWFFYRFFFQLEMGTVLKKLILKVDFHQSLIIQLPRIVSEM